MGWKQFILFAFGLELCVSNCRPKHDLKIGEVTRRKHEGDTAEMPLPSHRLSTTPQTGLMQGQEPPRLPAVHPQMPPHTQLRHCWWNQHRPCGKNYACFYHGFGLPSPSSWVELAFSNSPAPALPTLKVERDMGWDLGKTTKLTAKQRQTGHLLHYPSATR